MQKLLLMFLILFIAGCAKSEKKSAETADASERYDSALAKSLGADEYGMHQYVIAFLKAGPNRDQDPAAAARLQNAHLANIRRMAKEGKLVLAGPFTDDGDLRGIYIFNVPTVEEARKLTETDPAVKAGRLTLELHPWYGSAALNQVNSIHNKLSKVPR